MDASSELGEQVGGKIRAALREAGGLPRDVVDKLLHERD